MMIISFFHKIPQPTTSGAYCLQPWGFLPKCKESTVSEKDQQRKASVTGEHIPSRALCIEFLKPDASFGR